MTVRPAVELPSQRAQRMVDRVISKRDSARTHRALPWCAEVIPVLPANHMERSVATLRWKLRQYREACDALARYLELNGMQRARARRVVDYLRSGEAEADTEDRKRRVLALIRVVEVGEGVPQDFPP